MQSCIYLISVMQRWRVPVNDEHDEAVQNCWMKSVYISNSRGFVSESVRCGAAIMYWFDIGDATLACS